jgi:DNA polymerase I
MVVMPDFPAHEPVGALAHLPDYLADSANRAALFGWDDTPGIISVWAGRDGRAVIWRRAAGKLVREEDRFCPWLLATSLAPWQALGLPLVASPALPRTPLPAPDRAAIHYRALAAPAMLIGNSYRYLVWAATERLLEQPLRWAIAPPQSPGKREEIDYSLPASGEGRGGVEHGWDGPPPPAPPNRQPLVYRVGPVEQYLMLTGRVFFRGLSYDDLHRLQFDLETTALQPDQGRIFLVAVRDSRGLATVLEAPTPDGEARLIADLCALIAERDPDIIENHNLFGFDLPFLEARAARLRVPLVIGRSWKRAQRERNGAVGGIQISPRLLERWRETFTVGSESHERTRYSVAGRELIDTLDAVRRYDFVARDLPGHGLKEVARYFGLATAEREYIAGAAVWPTYQRDPDRVRRYALDDVAEVDGLSRRLMGAAFAIAGMAPRRYERLAAAGPAMGVLEPMLMRAYLRASAALPVSANTGNTASEPHAGGAVYLFAAGVARHVVKADVASLYPSLMRVYRIGPRSDHLGALLAFVDTLTEMRLQHKRAAQAAVSGAADWGWHEGRQAAMKLLINSAYGYMGAGSMALFADLDAANEVTRRGRDLLRQITDALAARGVALLEADTDGVYFAVPEDWDEAHERALVEEVGALLPDGIRLEYAGRYAAMFSHEVKNYALLDYAGRLTVRGVALKSSRVEPFGERFLRQALRCLLEGDVMGIRAAFLDTVAALRARTLPASDVTTQVRLAKSPQTYQRTRATRPEGQYEAFLAAGRNRWSPGDRVRFYRARGGLLIWLPDGDEEAGASPARDRRDYDIDYYVRLLRTSYAARLRKAFTPGDYEQLFRLEEQPGLFDQPVAGITPLWVRP